MNNPDDDFDPKYIIRSEKLPDDSNQEMIWNHRPTNKLIMIPVQNKIRSETYSDLNHLMIPVEKYIEYNNDFGPKLPDNDLYFRYRLIQVTV